MNRENILLSEYEKLAAQFAPSHANFRAWAKLARASGFRYAVFTTKHHEGYCLWDSQLTDFTSIKTAAQRDFVAEFVSAFRAEGLGVGLYFSLMDWNHPDGDAAGISDQPARTRYINFVHGQIAELCSNYGKIDILWYDIPWPYDADGWRSEEINQRVRDLQPGILINDRAKVVADFATSEGHLRPAEGGHPWEACITLNDNWGFHRGDETWKSAREIIATLAECAKFDGNLLLNIGPDGEGNIPDSACNILEEIGDWLRINGEAIYGTEKADVGWVNFGKMTRQGNTLYLIIDKWVGKELKLGRLSCEALSAKFLATGENIEFIQEAHGVRLVGLPDSPPQKLATVIAIEMDRPPKHSSGPSHRNPVHSWFDPNIGIV